MSSNSTLTMGTGAEIANSGWAGVMVRDGSHAEMSGGVRIVGTNGSGLVVANNSTATGPPNWAGVAAEISGSSARDVFCDGTSVVSNAAQINASKVTCPNLNSGATVPLPTQ